MKKSKILTYVIVCLVICMICMDGYSLIGIMLVIILVGARILLIALEDSNDYNDYNCPTMQDQWDKQQKDKR
jgi:predicted membrane protein